MARIDLEYSCGERWDAMELRAGGRHCGACGENVVDLSRLTQKEAARLIARTDAPCVSFEILADGEVAFRPEQRRAPRLVALGAAGLLAACAPGEPATCEIHPDPVELSAPLEPTATEDDGAHDATTEPPVAQLAVAPLPGAPTPSLARGDHASPGDPNDVDGAPPRGTRGTTPAVTRYPHRLAGRRPSISYTRRNPNF